MIIDRVFKSIAYRVLHLRDFWKEFYEYHQNQKLSISQTRFKDHLKYFRALTAPETDRGTLLVQMVMDYENTIKIAAASKIIAEQNKLSVSSYDVYITKINYALTNRTQLKLQKIRDRFLSNAMIEIYKSFSSGLIFRNSVAFRDQSFILKRKGEIKNYLLDNGVEAVLLLQIEDILVGDLIYDTYLRFKHRPTLIEVDDFLLEIIESSLNIFYAFQELIVAKNVQCLVNTYTSYIHHGITARICLNKGIDVYAVASGTYFMQKLTVDFPLHASNHSKFHPEKVISNENLDLAQNLLNLRFKGVIESATSYMQQSAFFTTPLDNNLRNQFNQLKRNIVVYAHDFYDSPHVYRSLQFADLYQYLKQTLIAVDDLTNTSVFVKLHPNSTDDTKSLTRRLISGFGNINFHILDEPVSNLHIIELRPDLICTARGTVGIEMAYFGLPVVALYDNPYVNFKFVHSCTTPAEYFAILRGEQSVEVDLDKDAIHSFYYQAYMEKAQFDDDKLMPLLGSFSGNTFIDEYLDFVDANSDSIFSDKLLNLYRNSYREENEGA